MARYSAVLFDMFDTLVRFDRDRLPAAQIGGREVRSSVPRAPPRRGRRPAGGRARDVLRRVSSGATRRPSGSGPRATRRSPRIGGSSSSTAASGADPAAIPPALTERLLATHMACLAGVAEPMPGQGELLDWLRGRYRLAVVSNFDYTPTVRRILSESGILGRFETVIVSDTVGWRKPRPDIFQRALGRHGRRGRGVPLRRRPAGHRRGGGQGSGHGGRLAQPGPGASARPGFPLRTSTSPACPTSDRPWRPVQKVLDAPGGISLVFCRNCRGRAASA